MAPTKPQNKAQRISTLCKRINNAGTAQQCKAIKKELDALSKRLDKKLTKLEEEENRIGYSFRGSNAFKCECGHCVDPTGRFLGTCEECCHYSCVDCLAECDLCHTSGFCLLKPCLELCAGCNSVTMCPDCRSRAKKCYHCDQPLCKDCPQKLCPECINECIIKNRF